MLDLEEGHIVTDVAVSHRNTTLAVPAYITAISTLAASQRSIVALWLSNYGVKLSRYCTLHTLAVPAYITAISTLDAAQRSIVALWLSNYGVKLSRYFTLHTLAVPAYITAISTLAASQRSIMALWLSNYGVTAELSLNSISRNSACHD
ncbi:hypothetical protein J6590_011891 [Homalodisca vitripennis]|nr:hypothetical protein J6590_011891 [Homalodisca vitripennis]